MRVLLIEDDQPLSRALASGLRGSGFVVDAARDAREARSFAHDHPYDLWILDLGLPDEDGLDLVRGARAREAHVPVLVLTARGAVADRVAGLDAGADDYLVKPFAFPELLARARALLRRSRAAEPVVFRVAALEVDFGRFEVRLRGARIALTVKEFSILELLIRHRGQLVTRSLVIDHCWGAGYDGLSNLVDVHVSRLRGKLEQAGSPPLIHTVRGAGFLFEEKGM